MRIGNFLIGAWSMVMARELYELMLGTEPMLQGWLGFTVWSLYVGMVYILGAIHASSVPRK